MFIVLLMRHANVVAHSRRSVGVAPLRLGGSSSQLPRCSAGAGLELFLLSEGILRKIEIQDEFFGPRPDHRQRSVGFTWSGVAHCPVSLCVFSPRLRMAMMMRPRPLPGLPIGEGPTDVTMSAQQPIQIFQNVLNFLH